MWLVAAAFLLLTVGSWIGAAGGATQITVSQCPDSPDPSNPNCQQSTTTLKPQSSRPAPSHQSGSSSSGTSSSPSSSAPAPKRGSETHNYSLKSGKGKVKTLAGGQQADALSVQVTPGATVRKPKAKPKPNSPTGGTTATPKPVTTTGGAGFAGLSTISSDRALAQFAVPPFLVPIYVAAGKTYGIPWNVLAGINRIETDFGRNLSVSSAGAEGWMQFMPESWKTYGVDASGDGVADPYNPVDAIYAAARYLRAAGGQTDIRKAIFAYNHANWYVDMVLKTAAVYGSLPAGLVAETGSLAYGRFPLLGHVRYGDDFHAGDRSAPGLLIHGKAGAQAVATQQVTVVRVLLDRATAKAYVHGARLRRLGQSSSANQAADSAEANRALGAAGQVAGAAAGAPVTGPVAVAASAGPRSHGRGVLPPASHGRLPAGYATTDQPGVGAIVRDAVGNQYRYTGLWSIKAAVRPGATLKGGAVIGAVARRIQPSTLGFSIIAAAGNSIDPRPLVDGYRLQEAANFYHAVAPFGANPFVPNEAAVHSGKGYVFPIPANVPWTSGRTDMGWDIETGSSSVGQPLLAVGDAQILHIQSMGAFGPTWISYRLLDGPASGKTIFIGHSGPPLVHAGQMVRAGQPIIRIQGGSYGGPPGHLEIGWGNPDGSNTLAAPHYSEGDVTAEGVSFKQFLLGVTGSPGGVRLPKVLGGGISGHATWKQEYRLSRELDRIANPHVLGKPGAGAVRLKGGAALLGAPSSAGSDFTPTSAGARIVDVSIPTPRQGDEAYAIGVVDGGGHRGWAAHQTVELRHRRGLWSIVGSPRAAGGRVANPRLHALAVASGGAGYAVGSGGAVVRLYPNRAPQMLTSGTHAALKSVAVRSGRPSGLAVGAKATVLRLAGSSVTREPGLHGAPALNAVAYDADGSALIAGEGAGTVIGLYRDTGQAGALGAKLGLPAGTQLTLNSIARRGRELWVAGGLDTQSENGMVPFVARRTSHGWETFCSSSPGMSAIRELGSPTKTSCTKALSGAEGAHGLARSVSAGGGRVLVAVDGGLEASLGDASAGYSFRPLRLGAERADAPAPMFAGVAVDARGLGLAWGNDGRMAQVGSRGVLDSTVPSLIHTPLSGPGLPLAVAPNAGGDRVLAVDAAGAAVFDGGAWRRFDGPRVPVRDALLTGGDSGWALADSGQLLRFDKGSWSLPGDRDSQLAALDALSHHLGQAPLAGPGRIHSSPGFNAVAGDESHAYAVGAHGRISRADGSDWSEEPSPTGENLLAAATTSRGAIAGGAGGIVLERSDSGWDVAPDAMRLADGRDVSAVAMLSDGTAVAAADTALIQRAPNGRWRRASLAPLGTRALALALYRRQGALHALALVNGIGGPALVDGTAQGWRTLSLPAGFTPFDLHTDQATGRIWVGGQRGDRAAAVDMAFPRRGR